jgi:hypothetical protein
MAKSQIQKKQQFRRKKSSGDQIIIAVSKQIITQ